MGNESNFLDKTFKGFAYAESKKPTVIYGLSQDEILEKLRGWNRARTAENQFKTCNIGKLTEGKYTDYVKFDVKTGQDISNIYLHIPPMGKEEFKTTIQEIKSAGAKYNPFQKAWYVEKGVDMAPFEKYLLPEQNAESLEKIDTIELLEEIYQEEELLPVEEKIEIPAYSVEALFKVTFDNLQREPVYIDPSEIKLVFDMPLNEVVDKIESEVRKALTPEEYQIGVSQKDNKCSVYFKDGKDTVTLCGEEFGVDFRNLDNAGVKEVVNGYLHSPNDFLEAVKNEVKEFAIGEEVDVYVAQQNGTGELEHIKGSIKEVIRSEEVKESLTYVVENENGEIAHVASANIYNESQSRVLLQAVKDGCSMEQMEFMSDMRFSSAQMDAIRSGFKDGLSCNQVACYCNPLLSAGQMDICRVGLIHGLSVTKIPCDPNPQFDWLSARNQLNEDIKEHRNVLSKEFTNNGFKANPELVKKLEELNHLTKRENSLKDISEAFKNKVYEPGSKEQSVVNEIGMGMKQQEIAAMQPVIQ